MLFIKTSAAEKREILQEKLKSGKLLRFPGAYSPIVACMIERIGFDGVYISGAVMANDLGYPDIALVGLEQIAMRAQQIARATELPVLADADTGFGEAMHFARTVQMMEEAGVSGIHIEDQKSPKRCGHLDNKELISTDEMLKKIKAGLAARRDKNFLLVVRCDARSVEGLGSAIERMQAYAAAGAEMIFPEALQDEQEFKQVREALNLPLLANMTEFGKTKLLDKDSLERLGFNLVIYPVTTQRLALKNVEDGLVSLLEHGTQVPILKKMQTRKELYELIQYKRYEIFDKDIYNFKL